MKKLFFLFLLFVSHLADAEILDEQKIETEDKQCAIHYLTPKSKNLWTIEINKHYCKEGWVQGFATVILRDALRRTARTLEGYFEKGYWLSDFPGKVDVVYKMILAPKKQHLIFQIAKEDELDVLFYLAAQTEEKDGQYGRFEVCSEEPLVVVEHQPGLDFKTSLFQTKVMKKARAHLLAKCPEIKKFEVRGVEHIEDLSSKWIFQAHMDLISEEMTLNYQSVTAKEEIPIPSELRHEQGENLITIHPRDDKRGEDSLLNLNIKEKVSSSQNKRKSAVDLALLAEVLQQEVRGKTVVNVTTRRSDYSFEVNRPLPLVLSSQEMLSSGWYLLDAIFQPQEEGVLVQVLSAKKCQKEWCADEK